MEVTVYFRATDQRIYQASGIFAWEIHDFIAIFPDAFPSDPALLGNTGLEGSHLVFANKAVGSKLQMFNSGAQTGPGD